MASETDEIAEGGNDENQDDKFGQHFVIMIALSVHSFFEGLALGLCTTFSSALSIFLIVF